MKVLVKSYKGTAGVWLDLPAIPQKGEELCFSMLTGLKGLARKEKRIAEESTAFIRDDEENENGNALYFVTNRTFHNNGVVVLSVRTCEKGD